MDVDGDGGWWWCCCCCSKSCSFKEACSLGWVGWRVGWLAALAGGGGGVVKAADEMTGDTGPRHTSLH